MCKQITADINSEPSNNGKPVHTGEGGANLNDWKFIKVANITPTGLVLTLAWGLDLH